VAQGRSETGQFINAEALLTTDFAGFGFGVFACVGKSEQCGQQKIFHNCHPRSHLSATLLVLDAALVPPRR
jgi:hypothetical protein